jgi:hypothetical protein
MVLLSVSLDDPNELFKPPEFPVLPPGRHGFALSEKLVITDSKTEGSSNKVVKISAKCTDDDENKGSMVWDNIVIVTDLSTDKAKKTHEISQKKLAQFTVACGIATKEEVQEQGYQVDLDRFEVGTEFEAMSNVKTSKNPTTGQEQQTAGIKRYLFEPEEGE